uniref:Uncharacterized protein n=1 Tax=Arundo donax TaxID=35708 RepID=A0A0A9G3T7_ARUDO
MLAPKFPPYVSMVSDGPLCHRGKGRQVIMKSGYGHCYSLSLQLLS